jgi:hypothetical protein
VKENTMDPISEAIGADVYLNRAQCAHFSHDAASGVHLYEDAGGTLVGHSFIGPVLAVAADALLRSKGGDGYDEAHRAILEPLGGSTLTLARFQGQGPGWFTVNHVITEFKDWDPTELAETMAAGDAAQRKALGGTGAGKLEL